MLVDEPVEGLEFPELAEELLPPEEELPELAGALAATAAGLAAIELLGVPLVELEVTETLAFEDVEPVDELLVPVPGAEAPPPLGFTTLTVCPIAALMAAPRLVLAASTALLVAAAGSSALAASVPPKVTAAATPIP